MEKPVSLYKDLILIYANEGSWILELCSGTGTDELNLWRDWLILCVIILHTIYYASFYNHSNISGIGFDEFYLSCMGSSPKMLPQSIIIYLNLPFQEFYHFIILVSSCEYIIVN